LTRIDQCGERELELLRRELASLAPGRPQIATVHRASALCDPSGARLDPRELAGREVTLASGIGHPDAFEKSVRALGAAIAAHERFPDHHAWSASDLALVRGDRMLVTTAKDAVKLRALGVACWVLEIELQVVEGLAVLDALLAALPEGDLERERRALHEGTHG
jgi:tetraacyldisaccharide 4'-kinase